MNTIIKFGLAALVAGAFSTLSSQAETPDTFTRHGLPIPGAYFKNKENQHPATVAVIIYEKRVGEQKQRMWKAGKKHTKRGSPEAPARQALGPLSQTEKQQ